VNLGDLAPHYVNGFVHAPWRTVAQYYITQFKTGVAPVLSADKVVFWYRAHPKAVSCSAGDRPRNADFPADAVFGLAMLASPAKVTLDIGSSHYEWSAPAGVSIGQVPFPVEDAQIPYIQIIRNGVKVKDGYGSMYVTKACDYYNFNPFVGIVQ
jgi:glucan endo-1,3-alpha-glucosidase